MDTQDFLVELGCEELPPKALKKLSQAFTDGVVKGLADAQLVHGQVTSFATPRRLGILIAGLSVQQDDVELEQFGPPIKAAFDQDGQPTKAAEGFAKKCGTTVDQLLQLDTDKGVKLAFRSIKTGEPASALLPNIVSRSLDALPIPKRMRWGSSRNEFVRPVKWLAMLLGTDVVECELLGQTAGNTTYGHRFHSNQPLTINAPADYPSLLADQGKVIADFAARQQLIVDQVNAAAADANGSAVMSPDLLDEVTALVEWPVALRGQFDEDFLRLPQETLVSSMAEHQKYFHMVNDAGELLPFFITVSNIDSQDPAQVIAGNERVVRPRLADAAFFFDSDQKTTLAARTELLKNIVFQAKLGSIYDKTQRVANIAAALAEMLNADSAKAQRAAELAKSDLVTQMVGEFADLQGIIGRYYAINDGEDPEVAEALFEQYLPRFAGDNLPQTATGQALAIAEKLDTMAGMFAIGQPPTGDKDPFALRRAALGILRIMVESQLDLDLRACIEVAVAQHSSLNPADDLSEQIFEFMLERFRSWFQDENIPADVFQAVHARRPSRPLDFQQRIYAVNHFAGLADAQALAAANKRVRNILEKQEASNQSADVSTHLLQESAEQDLANAVAEKSASVTPLIANGDYQQALEQLAALRPAVDNFFDSVMVMAEDEALRNNRIALLEQLRNLFLKVADISLLQSS